MSAASRVTVQRERFENESSWTEHKLIIAFVPCSFISKSRMNQNTFLNFTKNKYIEMCCYISTVQLPVCYFFKSNVSKLS